MSRDEQVAAQGRDGFDTTVVLDCGDTFRVNTDPRFMAFKVDDYASCSRHSAVRGYDPETGDPEYDRDRKIMEVRREPRAVASQRRRAPVGRSVAAHALLVVCGTGRVPDLSAWRELVAVDNALPLRRIGSRGATS